MERKGWLGPRDAVSQVQADTGANVPDDQRENGKSDNGTPGRDDQGVTAVRRERLSLDDAQILRLESAAIKGHTGKVLVLAPDSEGGALSSARLRDRVAERISAFPRLSQRVEEPRLRLGRPAWVEAPEVDLDWHVAETARPIRSRTRSSAGRSGTSSPSASIMRGRSGESTRCR